MENLTLIEKFLIGIKIIKDHLTFSYKFTVEERKIFIENKEMLLKALKQIYKTASIEDETILLINNTKEHAINHMPQEIIDKISNIREKAFKLYEYKEKLFGCNSLPIGEERSKIAELKKDLLNDLFKEKEHVDILYRKHLMNDNNASLRRKAKPDCGNPRKR